MQGFEALGSDPKLSTGNTGKAIVSAQHWALIRPRTSVSRRYTSRLQTGIAIRSRSAPRKRIIANAVMIFTPLGRGELQHFARSHRLAGSPRSTAARIDRSLPSFSISARGRLISWQGCTLMPLSRLHTMRLFRPRVLCATDLPDEIADQARALAVALANPGMPPDERVALRRAFSKRLSSEVWSIRVAGWDEVNREFWQKRETAAPTSAGRPTPTPAGRGGAAALSAAGSELRGRR